MWQVEVLYASSYLVHDSFHSQNNCIQCWLTSPFGTETDLDKQTKDNTELET